jgi:hypothetical protein
VTGRQRSKPAHAAREAGPASRVLVAVIGAAVLAAAVSIGAAALCPDDKPTGSTPGSARLITITPPVPPQDKRP